jgi:PAS domain S-box-containing protein
MPKPLNILIVEDLQDDADLVVAQLRRAGFDPKWKRVQTEADFLAEIKNLPELIISDYSMPRFTGLRAAELLQKSGLDIPFILISGTVGEDVAVEAMKHGASDYLLKDRIVRLGSAVEHALERKRLRAEHRQADEELRWKTAFLEAQMDSSPDAILVVDESARKIFQNGKLLQMFKVPHQIIYDDDDIKLLRHVTSQTKNPEQFTERVAHLYEHADEVGRDEIELVDGRILDRFSAPVHDKAAKYYGRIWVFRDISERKLAEARLRDSEERYRSVVENARDAIFTISSDGMLTSTNAASEAITGFRREDWIGKPFGLLAHPEDLPLAAELFQRALAGEKTPTVELRVRTVSGKHVMMEFLSAPQVENGQVTGVLGIGRDITKRKRMEESFARLATAVEQVAETIVITDTQGTIIYVNPAFEKTTGFMRDEVLGKNPRILKSGKQDAEFYRRMWDVLKRGEVWHGHFINIRKDGKPYEEEATISPMRDSRGVVVNYVAVKRDVTAEMQIEAQFRQLQKMQAIGHLAGGMAHDFNNILAVIQMQADIMGTDASLSSEQLELARQIGEAAQRGAALTRPLLLFSRKQTLQLRDMDLNQSINQITRILKRTLGENIELHFKFALQPLYIHADSGMMDQVLMNLAVNSRDAMPEGGQLIIETSAVQFDESVSAESAAGRPGSFVCLSVSDNGCGIPPEILPNIFEPFFTTKEIGKGTGLGLATVFGIVQQHKGWINVYSETGQGTTFRIYIPQLEKLSTQNPALTDSNEILGGNETILLVEDDVFLASSIRKALSQLGYRVLEAINGNEAVVIWKEHRDEIHLLLTDMVMPGGMTGLRLAERLLKENPKLKVIYVSGYAAEIAGKDIPLEEGVNFLTKPFEAHKLAQTVRRQLDPKNNL